MNWIIVYKSKTGFTKQYAEWIGEELGFAVRSLDGLDAAGLNGYDAVIFGGGIRAGIIGGLKRLKKLMPRSAKLVVFATGASPAFVNKEIEKVWNTNFIGGELDSIPHFYMQSGLCFEKMGFVDRTLMKIFNKIISSGKAKTDIDEGFKQALSASYDFSSREYIRPIAEYVRSMGA